MKTIRKGFSGALLAISALVLASCGGTGDATTTATTTAAPTTTTPAAVTTTEAVQKYAVTFNTVGGSTVASQEVEKNGKVSKPADPTKDNYIFGGWYKEEACENAFDFDVDVITADTTLYASWVDASSSTSAKFYWNYEGADVYKTVAFNDGSRISKPEDPVREGYIFDGWYTSTTYETAYSKGTKYSGNQSFYAKWLKSFVMEAEDTQLTGLTYSPAMAGVMTQTGDKKGVNFSGNVSGKNLIREDSGSSGGKFVWGCLNLEEGYLDFEFTADKADSSASLYIRLSAEFRGFEMTPDMFKVLVNPEDNDDDSVDYAKIDLTFVQTSTDSTAHPTWVDAYINRISIQEGENLIRLYVNNDNGNSAGTITAQGPVVDCITIGSIAELVMTKY